MTIPGWYTNRSAYTASDGSSATGSLYSYGSTGSSDRALGDVGSGSTGTILAAVRLVNNTGATITSLDISFVGEQWRSGGSSTATPSVAQTVDFQYQVANPGVVTDANVPLTAGWVDYNPLDFTSPKFGTTTASALDGNAAANRVPLSSTLTVTVTPGQEIWLRWLDVDHANNDHGMAIDDFSVTANGAGSTNPSGTGASSPSSVLADGTSTTLLTVTVTPGTSPISSGLAVKADLSPIGGSTTQQFFDDGTNGDATAGDKIFSYRTTVATGTSGGSKSLNATITDAQSRTGSATIPLTVLAPTPPSGTGAANPNPVQAGNSTLLTVTVTPGTNPTSTGLTVTGDLGQIGGSATQQFYDDGTNGDVTAGNNVFSFSAAIPANTSSGLKTLPVQVADAQGRSASTSISLSVQAAPPPPGSVVISQVYGGGGNAGATYKNDFIEIFNRSSNPIDLTGWSVQYASASGTSWQVTPLTSVILQPGQYYLVQEAAGSGGSDNLPTPDATGSIAMSATSAKIALVRTSTALSGSCPAGGNLIDLVGYGSANCFEGAGAAPTLSNTTAALRARNGCKDTDYNAANFTDAAPSPRNTSSLTNVCPPGDEAPEVFSTTPSNGAISVALTSNVTINFDQNVTVTGNWFYISCATSGVHTATATGGPATFTLNPDTDFAGDEQCTVTVFATQVTDQDTQDPPDNMVADYTFSFHTFIPRDPAEHLVMGNPSGAGTADNNNYLLMKEQYAHSHNCQRGTPNWVSWHLDQSWLGSAPRQDDFRADPSVPCYQVQGTDYQGSGFDRGHMTPSADRTSTIADNSATFFMSNMVPQAPNNNQGPWEDLESEARTIVGQGNELYIVSGPLGTGGVGRNGAASTIAGGNVTVPAYTWKVVLVLPVGTNDVARVNTSTRAFGILIPNDQNAVDINANWEKYLTTVDQIEALTGYDFFSNVDDSVEAVIEARLDDAANTAPVADSQSATTAEDTPKQITLTASDINVNNVLTYTVVSGPSHGVLSGTGANLTYTPDANYNGPDSFTFKANDGGKDSNVATVSISVTPVNDAPAANADSVNTDEDVAATVNVLANDTDVEGDTLTITVVGAASHGTAALISGGDIKYTPAPDFNGADSFTYTISDGHSGTTTGTVSVTVASVNDNPVANGDSATTDEDTAATIDVLQNDADVDGDTLTLQSVGGATNGTVSVVSNQAVFTPDANYHGTGSFNYTASDGHGGTATASVTVTINSVNDNPVANADAATTDEDTAVVISVRANDTDVDGDALSITSAGGASKGSVAVTADGKVRYTPNANANGADSFTYTIADGNGGTATGSVSVTINPVNDAPVVSNVPATATIPELAAYAFTAQATDVDGDALTFSLVDAPAGASINPATGQFTWTPTEAQGGTGTAYSFTVRVWDGTVNVDSPVSVTVTEVNQAPTLNHIGNQTVFLGTTLTFTASGADADLPAQTLTYSLTGAYPAGASINPATGAFTWTPVAAQAGQTYTFGVRVTDNGPSTCNANNSPCYAEETITVGAAYSWSGLLQPINADGSSIFHLGSTIPVKFYLTGASAGITNAVARLYVAKVSDGITGTEVEADSTSAATTGNLFRYDVTSGQYIFNLSTNGLTPGTYQLRVDTGDGVLRVTNISLRD